MPELPSHASPYFSPQSPVTGAVDSELSLNSPPSGTAMTTTIKPSHTHHAGSAIGERRHHDEESSQDQDSGTESDRDRPSVPASFLSPAFTPPATPGGTLTPARQLLQSQLNDIRQHHQHQGSDLSRATKKAPKLLAQLPNVECIVRARIPTTTGAEMFLHLYHNDIDNKEHLAIVFGNTIRSRSLDRVRPGETEMDRMIRGAYVGKLHPGRISSWYDSEQAEGSTSTNMGESTDIGTGRGETSRAMKPTDGSDGLARATTSQSQHQAPLVRIHSECYTGETAWSARCDCGEQLDEAARLMSFPNETWGGVTSSSSITTDPTSEPGTASTASSHLLQPPPTTPGGVIIYLRQEGRGIGLGEKLKAYNLQDLGSDTVEANLLLRHPADARSYGLATAMLVDLGLGVDENPEGIRLLTNNPDKVRAVEGANREVRVKERVPMIPLAWRTGGKRGIKSSEVEGYLRTKIAKMGHMIQ